MEHFVVIVHNLHKVICRCHPNMKLKQSDYQYIFKIIQKIITRIHLLSDYLNAYKDRTQEGHKNKQKQILQT